MPFVSKLCIFFLMGQFSAKNIDLTFLTWYKKSRYQKINLIFCNLYKNSSRYFVAKNINLVENQPIKSTCNFAVPYSHTIASYKLYWVLTLTEFSIRSNSTGHSAPSIEAGSSPSPPYSNCIMDESALRTVPS